MTLATVKLQHADGRAVLSEDGWSIDGWPEGSPLIEALNRFASTSLFGPADGDPVVCAAARAAQILDGAIDFVREPEPVPDDAVF